MGRGSLALVAAVLAAVFVVAGCGDDSSSANSISKEEFIAKADAICKQGTRRMEAGLVKFLTDGGKIQKPSQADNEQFIVTVLTPSLKREIKELRALGVPDDDEERIEAMVTSLEEGLDTAEDNPEVVAAGSTDIVFGIASRLAGELGIETCGSR